MWLIRLFVPFYLGSSYMWKGCSCLFDGSILLFTDTYNKGLYGVSSDTGILYTVGVKSVFNPIAIHYNEQNERIYWSDVQLGEIRSTSIDGKDDVRLWDLSNGSIADGLAVDAITGLLFYTDAGNHLIALMDLDGNHHAVVIYKDCDKPRAIVLDSMNGHMYWSDWGEVPKIETANYDGTERKEIITTGLLWPNALAIDFSGQWMYWGDAGTHYIERSKLDGSSRRVLYYEPKAHYFSILALPNILYYTDWQYRNVMSLKLSGEQNSTAVGSASSAARLNDITRLKPKVHAPRTNACSKSNGGCSHFCLPRPKGKYTCMCPSGSYLVDEKQCSKSKSSANCAPLRSNNFLTIYSKDCIARSSPVGTVCIVKCMEGFVYGGYNNELVCKEDGQWSGIIHDCLDVRRPVIHNCPKDWQAFSADKGKDTVAVKWSDDVYATDNSGIAPKVYQSMKSGVTLHEGEHTVNIFAVDHAGHFAVCEFTVTVKVNRCGVVPVPKRGYIKSGWCPDYYGAICKIACNTGYQFTSNIDIATITCSLDEDKSTHWTGDYLQCEPISCPAITSPNVLVTGCNAPLNIGEVCEQTCADGFEVIYGPSVRICKFDGTWSGQDLICRGKSILCPQLPPVIHTSVEGCSYPFTVGSVCVQFCNIGYAKEGHGSGARVCNSDGTWSGHDISCSRSDTLSGNMPKPSAETYTTYSVKDSNVFLNALVVVVVSLILVNIGIFIHLQKNSSNRKSTAIINNENHESTPSASS